MKKIVVFGASGNLGEHFIRYFLSQSNCEYEIIASGRREKSIYNRMGISYIKTDITKKKDFELLPTDVYAVVDFAGAMPAKMSGYNPQKYIDVNVTGTLNILEYCKKCGVDRILYMQSFGDIKDRGEDEVYLRPDMSRKMSFATDHTLYVLSKNFGVDLIENYHQLYGIKRFIFRLPTIYRYFHSDRYYVDGKEKQIGFSLIINNAIRGDDIEVWGDPSRVKDMIYIEDFCQMIYRALFVNISEGYYNVGTGVGTSLIDQINGIIDVFCSEENKSRLVFRPDKPNSPQYIMDISKAKEELGYEPQYDYIKMLQAYKKEMTKEREGD